ncbi:MAG TPA: transposase [Thermomicrobiales bacterium]|nr:transposase [Thermomicrobiales bacterium]
MDRYDSRRRQRLPGYDYAQANVYFVTITTHQFVARFGTIRNATVELNDAGRTVERFWRLIPRRYPTAIIDAFVVMPDHFHGILVLGGESKGRPTLPRIMQWFKSWTTTEYATGVQEMDWEPFDGKLWHTGYYAHICRDEIDIERIRAYIESNPDRRWRKMLLGKEAPS